MTYEVNDYGLKMGVHVHCYECTDDNLSWVCAFELKSVERANKFAELLSEIIPTCSMTDPFEEMARVVKSNMNRKKETIIRKVALVKLGQ